MTALCPSRFSFLSAGYELLWKPTGYGEWKAMSISGSRAHTVPQKPRPYLSGTRLHLNALRFQCRFFHCHLPQLHSVVCLFFPPMAKLLVNLVSFPYPQHRTPVQDKIKHNLIEKLSNLGYGPSLLLFYGCKGLCWHSAPGACSLRWRQCAARCIAKC